MPIQIRRLLLHPTLHPIRPRWYDRQSSKCKLAIAFLCGLLAKYRHYTHNRMVLSVIA
jgi:hypothetical protein